MVDLILHLVIQQFSMVSSHKLSEGRNLHGTNGEPVDHVGIIIFLPAIDCIMTSFFGFGRFSQNPPESRPKAASDPPVENPINTKKEAKEEAPFDLILVPCSQGSSPILQALRKELHNLPLQEWNRGNKLDLEKKVVLLLALTGQDLFCQLFTDDGHFAGLNLPPTTRVFSYPWISPCSGHCCLLVRPYEFGFQQKLSSTEEYSNFYVISYQRWDIPVVGLSYHFSSFPDLDFKYSPIPSLSFDGTFDICI